MLASETAGLAAPWANPGRGWTYQKAPPKEAQPGGQEKKEEKKEEIKAEPIDVSDVTNIVLNVQNYVFEPNEIRRIADSRCLYSRSRYACVFCA